MKPNPEFLKQDKSFWAFVRTVSQEVGYTQSGDTIKTPTLVEIAEALTALKLDSEAVVQNGSQTELGGKLVSYFQYRATAIAGVQGNLQNADEAEKMFNAIKETCPHVCALPMNKQTGDKKAFAFLTCVITMLLEQALEELTPLKTTPVEEADSSEARSNWLTWKQVDSLGQRLGANSYVKQLVQDRHIRTAKRKRITVYHPGDIQRLRPHCDYDPRTLTTATQARRPLRTLARRVDGAYPGPVNPIAVWEIKEYYYTTTFGSRVADGIYETLLDGVELEELRSVGPHVRHYLFVDGYKTWWEDGKSYLCRLVDALHMEYVDEVLFGCEIIDRLPQLAKEWVELRKQADAPQSNPEPRSET